MLQALFERFGQLVSFDGRSLWAFWDPESIHRAAEEELRALKLGYRAKIEATGRAVHAGRDRQAQAEKDLRQRGSYQGARPDLRRRPSVRCYMLFEHFHFYDTLEYIPPWEGKIMGADPAWARGAA